MEKTFKIFCVALIYGFINIHLSHADINLNNDFLREIKDSGMRFDPPKEYDSVAVRQNRHVAYSLAIRSKLYNMEVRYAIHQAMPAEALLGHFAYFTTVVANIAQSENPFNLPHQEFEQADVQTEFNADWGATSMFPAKPSFAAPFNSCLLVNVSKSGRGSAFIMYLFNREDVNTVLPEINRIFYALRFK